MFSCFCTYSCKGSPSVAQTSYIRAARIHPCLLSIPEQLESILVCDLHAVEEGLWPGLVALHPVQDAGDVAGRVDELALALLYEGMLQQLVVFGPLALLLVIK